MSLSREPTGVLISRRQPLALDHLGPTVEVLTENEPPSAPGVVRGTIPAGGVVPMHRHSDPETFYVLDGTVQALTFASADGPVWQELQAGQVFHVPPHTRHALRNTSRAAATTLIISTTDMARFFEQTGRPLQSTDEPRTPPSPQDVERMLRVASQHGHWLASPQENVAVGIHLPDPESPAR